jgi:hypothetical protein
MEMGFAQRLLPLPAQRQLPLSLTFRVATVVFDIAVVSSSPVRPEYSRSECIEGLPGTVAGRCP